MTSLNLLTQKKEFFFIKRLQKQFPRAEVFLVGGIIRDILLKRQSKDYDFVIRNVPLNKLQSFLKRLGWVDLVGKHFGVLKFLPKHVKQLEPFDIALPRTEHAFGTGGYQDFNIQSSPTLPIEQDLQRRDFTINALAYNIKNKKLIDRFGGQNDIKRQRIKTVGTPSERFREDYSRLLRALRFAGQLNFNIEQQTWTALNKLMPHINKKINGEFIIPRETIAREMTKTFLSDPTRALELYYKSGAVKALMPELLKMKDCPQPKNFHSEGDVWKHTLLCLKNLQSVQFRKKFGTELWSAELVFALLFHDIAKPYTIEQKDRLRFNNHDTKGAEMGRQIMEKLKLPSAGVDVETTVWLVRQHMIATHTKKSPMKKTTLEKYFFREPDRGLDLLKLMYADIMATVPLNGRPDFTDFNHLKKQINQLKKVMKRKKTLPKELLNGNEIMKALKLKPGPKVGELKNLLREEQLANNITTKKQATLFLKKYAKLHYSKPDQRTTTR